MGEIFGMKSIAHIIQDAARTTPSKVAVIVGDEKCTYEELAEKNAKAAALLMDRGIAAGDRVIVEADHTLAYVYILYGIQLLGATFVPLEKNTPTKRILEIAGELDTGRLITLESREDLPQAWSLTGLCEELATREDSFAVSETEPDALAEILFTTGTTGKSKGVMVSFENQMNIALAGVETTQIREDNVWLIPTPMNHAAGLRKLHIAMAVGSTAVLLEGFRNVKEYFRTIHEHQVTSLYLPPPAIHFLLMLASRELAALNGQLRFIYSSSTAYPEKDKELMRQLLPDVYMYNCFGCSEVGVVCADEFCVSGGSQYSGSVGRPNSLSEIVLLDENFNEVETATAQAPALVGIRSKSVMRGYWNEPEQTAKALHNGMLLMSDLCYFADNGELILVGRSNDTINIGGFKVAPAEVEDVVRRVDCVDDCVLILVSRGGNQSLKLLVQLKTGMELDTNAIRACIADNLEPYKMPKKIEVVEEIARTFNGKLDRKEMIRRHG